MGKEHEGYSGRQALGIIETQGRAPLIEAVDCAIKAAAVTLKTSYFVGGGLNAVTLVGDVGAMRAALDAAKAAIDRMAAVGQTHLIPRLAPEVRPVIEGSSPSPPQKGLRTSAGISKVENNREEPGIFYEEELPPGPPAPEKKPRKRRKPKDTSS